MSTMAAGVVIALLTPSAMAADRYDQFRLWVVCSPVAVVVEELGKDAKKIGLRKADIETTVRSRLRGARLYAEDAPSDLYARISVLSRSYSIEMHFMKLVQDLGGRMGQATTWDTGMIGTHGNNPNHILSKVGQHTERFIDEYLRVNGEVCE